MGNRLGGFATEILIHRSSEGDGQMCVSLVGEGDIYTYWVDSAREDQDAHDAAIHMATNLEAATGLRWRIHEESRGPFRATY